MAVVIWLGSESWGEIAAPAALDCWSWLGYVWFYTVGTSQLVNHLASASELLVLRRNQRYLFSDGRMAMVTSSRLRTLRPGAEFAVYHVCQAPDKQGLRAENQPNNLTT